MRDRERFEAVSDEMAAVLRTKTPSERLAIAHGMWRFARSMILGAVKKEHPDWTDHRIEREVARRLSHGAV